MAVLLGSRRVCSRVDGSILAQTFSLLGSGIQNPVGRPRLFVDWADLISHTTYLSIPVDDLKHDWNNWDPNSMQIIHAVGTGCTPHTITEAGFLHFSYVEGGVTTAERTEKMKGIITRQSRKQYSQAFVKKAINSDNSARRINR